MLRFKSLNADKNSKKASQILKFYDKIHQAIKIINMTKMSQGSSGFGIGADKHGKKFKVIFVKLYLKLY